MTPFKRRGPGTKRAARDPWKTFQNEVGDALEAARLNGWVRKKDRLEDGMRMVRTGPKPEDMRAIGATKTPSDYFATSPVNGLVLVEAKRTTAPRLPIAMVEHATGKWSDSTGLKGHQIEWITDVDQHAGIGMVVVAFDCLVKDQQVTRVYALRGRLIADFRALNPDRASIPLEWFQAHGYYLGVPGRWRFCAECFRA